MWNFSVMLKYIIYAVPLETEKADLKKVMMTTAKD